MKANNRLHFISSHYKIPVICLLLFLSLHVTAQTAKKQTAIPNLVGITLSDAKKVLSKANIAIGAIIFSGGENTDTINDSHIIIRQYPASKTDPASLRLFRKNRLIDIWVSKIYLWDSVLNKTRSAGKRINHDFH